MASVATIPAPSILASERGYDEIVATIREAEQKRPPEEPRNTQDDERPGIPDELLLAYRDGDEDGAIHGLEKPRRRYASIFGVTARTDVGVATEAWADVNARSKWGEGPLEVAGFVKKGGAGQLKPMIDLRLARGTDQTPYWAIKTGDVEWLRARHAAGTPGKPIYGGGGWVTLAAKFDCPEIHTWLLDIGHGPGERRRPDLEPAEDTWGHPLRDCVRRIDSAARGRLPTSESRPVGLAPVRGQL